MRTFMSALESSPVHCVKSRPSGKRRSPGNTGTPDILKSYYISKLELRVEKAPTGDQYLR